MCTRYPAGVGGRTRQIVIVIRLDELLENHERSFYWLAKETGISHTTLWRLKKGKALGINFDTLERICRALNCQPGDVIRLATADKKARRHSTKGRRINLEN
jgi:putative transcriptional regulator